MRLKKNLNQNQIEDEIIMYLCRLTTCPFHIRICEDSLWSCRSESDENREMSTNLTEALQIKDRKYDIDEGDGSFCVPQTDTKFKDTIGGKQSSYTFQAEEQADDEEMNCGGLECCNNGCKWAAHLHCPSNI
uniref:Uncharacterized protein n=1 Tax=Physcomitrium patens TaxID=3218 RepID=A0A2K1J423_PHYPA|nr:hypothetical protein PHYPA_022136 [Physcomitrium patens]